MYSYDFKLCTWLDNSNTHVWGKFYDVTKISYPIIPILLFQHFRAVLHEIPPCLNMNSKKPVWYVMPNLYIYHYIETEPKNSQYFILKWDFSESWFFGKFRNFQKFVVTSHKNCWRQQKNFAPFFSFGYGLLMCKVWDTICKLFRSCKVTVKLHISPPPPPSFEEP